MFWNSREGERRERVKVFVATPMLNFQPDAGYALGLADSVESLRDYRFFPQPIFQCAVVAHARNVLTSMFLSSGEQPQWLLWIDSDIQFGADDVRRLLEAGVQIIGGYYSKKGLPSKTPYVKNEPQQVDFVDGGFLLVERPVVQAMHDREIEAGNWYRFRLPHEKEPRVVANIYETPNPQVTQNEFVSEDHAWSAKARRAGFTLYMSNVQVLHAGRMGF